MIIIKDFHNKIFNKEKTVVELISEYLENIQTTNPKLNSFITITKESALQKARLLDEELSKTSPEEILKTKPLFGIPIAHKDIFSTKGVETTAASNILRGYIPPYDATVVKKLENAGCIMLGKLNCDAFAHGASGVNSDFGNTLNPYDFNRIPGGSSSGSGVAVATNQVCVATGSDTGGSVRNPASFTNTVGLKPTYGRVSRYGVYAMASSLDSIGHITNTVEDNAKILNVTAGFDENDATSSKIATEDYTQDLNLGVKGLKIGIPKEYFTNELDPQVKKSIENSIQIYTKLGAEIVDISLPHTEYALAVYYTLTPSEVSSNLGRLDGIRYGQDRTKFGAEAKRRIMIGTYVLSAGYYDAYYLKALKVRALIKKNFEEAFKKVDLILAPVAPCLPLRFDEDLTDPMKLYLTDILTVTANLAGIPALALPSGFSEEGLPIGMQLMGNYFEEKLLFRVANAYEQETKLYERRPSL